MALTRWLVSIPSVNPVLESGGAGEAHIASACAELLEDWGFDTSLTEPAPGRPNVVGRLDGTGPTLLLNGHLDTYPIGVRTSWSDDPLSGAIRDGRLFGRGSADMKGGVAALVLVMQLFAEHLRPFPGELVLALAPLHQPACLLPVIVFLTAPFTFNRPW